MRVLVVDDETLARSLMIEHLAKIPGIEVVGETVFQDHHRYDVDDVSRIRSDAQSAGADIVLTTEKDAGKLPPFLVPQDSWWALRVRAEVVRGEERLRSLVLGYPEKVL